MPHFRAVIFQIRKGGVLDEFVESMAYRSDLGQAKVSVLSDPGTYR